MFEDRTAAGARLSDRLAERDLRPDTVFAVPTGGAGVARPIAERFDADLGLIAAESIRPPSEDVPLGAVTDTGATWVDDRLVETFGVDEEKLEAEKHRAFREARNKHETFDEIDEDPTPEGVVVIVDDGIVTGTAMKACATAMSEVDSCYTVAVAPVGASESVVELHGVADEVVVETTAPSFELLDQFYETFDTSVIP
ncbi:phosphoribosyltransferase [Halorubrum saccharovorum DSM 1137]|uniref:Phosphoribosyltransferase n=1 Tax=Halorubrum saccharovorum DSM 1137 TaxID=1227484 RepID=M0DM48_9EURY|nr:phosphoribosyltransferase family protein [Halorubrum saccharovorum]ELZ36556.1 phosphoribosyltransferase [Halorubrum saccharovorum DSM 1137]